METHLGIDIGSLYMAVAVTGPDGALLQSTYERHQGDIVGSCRRILKSLDLSDVETYAVTGIGGEGIEGLGKAIDPMVALVEGAKSLFPGVKNIIYVGAGSYSLIRLNERGEYLGHATNTACASGTGSFLDQQAMRLGFPPEELSARAEGAARSPSVATRCAVFAKTDMIHLQQEGFKPTEIAAGLCESLGQALVQMLLKGRKIRGETVLAGGVARNTRVRAALEKTLGVSVSLPQRPELLAAIGAAKIASRSEGRGVLSIDEISSGNESASSHRQPPLDLKLSKYPEFKSHDFRIDDEGTEIALPRPLERGKTYVVAMGVDIGSTSTKAVLMDRDRSVVALAYRATAGDPIKATQKVFRAFRGVEEREGVRFDVVGAGTTGSGRKMMKAVLGAELEKDEITAHARAATFLDPGVDTIVEIGGQDSKFTQLERGVVVNSVMNYVCAAGTGSFIEEQAKNLGVSVWDYANFVEGAHAPITSDRCTVFMERDLKQRLAEGCTRQEAAAAVLYSVRDNYLNKVVNGLKIGERVYFQGATARNRALVAAFEHALQKPILVSEYCHVTGAMGIALMLLESEPREKTFRGLSFGESEIETSSQVCELCANRCNLTLIRAGDQTVAWGLKCGREYHDAKPKPKDRSRFQMFESRRKRMLEGAAEPAAGSKFRVGVPRALTTWGYYPLWKEFFGRLGGEVVLSPASSDRIMETGRENITAEFCAPVVMGLGHVSSLIESGLEYVFLPVMIREKKTENVTDAQFCCFVQGFGPVVKSTEVARAAAGKSRVISPVVEFGLPEKKVVKTLLKGFDDAGLVFRPSEVASAYRAGLAKQAEFERANREEGEAGLAALRGKGEMGVVIIGRPYNVNDPGLNLDLPRKISQMGVTPVPMEALPSRPEDLGDEWNNMYWNYGQRIVAAAEYVAKTDNLFGVLFTNFACGPDSYLVSYFKSVMGKAHKPYLILQFDGHGADAGYMTRIEAAIESFRAWKPAPVDRPVRRASGAVGPERTIMIPPMDPFTVHFLAACFRGHGHKAEVLDENAVTLASGYKHCQGGECAPCPSTLGSIISYVEATGRKPSELAFFMPTASGPCRFGQYQRLAEIVFDQKGWQDLLILSPSGVNTYQGLSQALRRQLWDAVVIGDLLQKILFRLRPYEQRVGETERVLWKAINAICDDLSLRRDPAPSLKAAVDEFSAIPVRKEKRPLVGIVGEIYLRTNHFLNEDLARVIEKLGGEATKATLGEWFHYTSWLAKNLDRGGKSRIFTKVNAYLKDWFFDSHENRFLKIVEKVLPDCHEPHIDEVVKAGSRYVPPEFEGESILTIGRALLMFERDKVDAVVNASPSFCMPGTITTSLFSRIEEEVGKPVVCLFYDGSGNPNQAMVPHMHFLRSRLGLEPVADEPVKPGGAGALQA